MSDTTYDQVVARLRKLPRKRQAQLVDAMNERIRETGGRAPTADDLPMAAIARRIYWLGLRRGIRLKAESKSKKTKSGPPIPQHQVMEQSLDELASELKIAGFDRLDAHSKTVELFCTHKVRRGNNVPGFYVLAALYAWHEEAVGNFNPEDDRHMIPEREINLGLDMFLFFARRLNEEALANHEERPFPRVLPARPETDLKRVPFFYLQHREHADRVLRIFETYKTPKLADDSFGDDCAHFILFRGRLSDPADVMKSFLAIKPLVTNPREKHVEHHPTFHIYQAPRQLGGASWGTPGRILPLNAGLYIVGGQHAQALDTRTGKVRDAGAPFRALEMIFFPWSAFETTPLMGGVIMSVNNDGEPLVSRICARPTLIQTAKDARIGAVSLIKLSQDIAIDLEAERTAAKLAIGTDTSVFLEIYERYGKITDMAERAAELCNNHSNDSWRLMPGLTKDDQDVVRGADLQGIFDDAVAGVVNAQNEPFSVKRDFRIPPLTVL